MPWHVARLLLYARPLLPEPRIDVVRPHGPAVPQQHALGTAAALVRVFFAEPSGENKPVSHAFANPRVRWEGTQCWNQTHGQCNVPVVLLNVHLSVVLMEVSYGLCTRFPNGSCARESARASVPPLLLTCRKWLMPQTPCMLVACVLSRYNRQNTYEAHAARRCITVTVTQQHALENSNRRLLRAACPCSGAAGLVRPHERLDGAAG